MKLATQRISIATAYIIQYEELYQHCAKKTRKKDFCTYTHDILSYDKKYYQTKLVTGHHILSTICSPLMASTKANFTKQFVAMCNI